MADPAALITDYLPSWWGRAPRDAAWDEVFVPVRAPAGTVWSNADVLSDFVVLAEGRLHMAFDGPLPSYRRTTEGPGRVVGGLEALSDLGAAGLPDLQGLRCSATCLTEVHGWRLPTARVFHERDLDPLVAALRDEALLSFDRSSLADLLDEVLGWPGADRGLVLRLVDDLPLLVLQAGEPLVLPPELLAIVLSGALVDDAGLRQPLGRLRTVDPKAWLGEPLPRGSWAARERTVLALVDRSDVQAALAEVPGEDLASPIARLRRCHLWRRMPRDVRADDHFTLRQLQPGEVVARSPRGGWTLGDPAGSFCFVVEGEVVVEHWVSGREQGERGVMPGGWFGGTGWLDRQIELLRMPEIVRYSFVARARTKATVLVARPPEDRSHPVVEPMTRIIRERLLIECQREPMAEALRRNRSLATAPHGLADQLLDRGRLVRIARGTVLSPPSEEFFLFLRGELVRHPGRDDRRRLFPPEPLDLLGFTEFLHGWAPVGTWEADSTCWLLRFRRTELNGLRSMRQLVEDKRSSASFDFDKAGGAEIVMLHSTDLQVGVLARLADLLGQTIAREFQDLVLVVRLPRGTTPDHARLEPQTATLPARVTLPLPADDQVDALTPHLREWNRRFAWIILVPVLADPRAMEQALSPLVERLVVLTRDPSHLSDLAVTVDTTILTTVLLPDEPWIGRPRWHSGGVPHPGFPDGSVRLRLDGLLTELAARPALLPVLGELDPDDQDRIARWGRALTDRRVALALGGGGAWGYVHVAMILELAHRRVPIDLVSGSSFGAVVGALYGAAGIKGLELLVAAGPLFGRTMPFNYLSTRALGTAIEALLVAGIALRDLEPLDIPWSERAMKPAEAAEILRAGWQGGRRLVKRGEDGLQWPALNLEDLEVPFFPVATDLDTGSEVVLESGPVALGVRASGSFPGLFSSTPHPVDGRPLVDGGIASNVPDRVLSRQGAALIIASNPVPPPRPTSAQRGLGARIPIVRRIEQGARSVYIMMHHMGQKDRRVVGASYNSPPVEHGITEVALSREIVARSYKQDEFRDALHQAQQSWRQLARPRQVDARATATAREERWTDLARTGYAVVMPQGMDRRSAVYRALKPLLELRRHQVERRRAATYREILGAEGVRPGESLASLLSRLGASPGVVQPEVLPYHVLIVGPPEAISLDLQVELDLDYAVGRLWLDDPEDLARYARRVVAEEGRGFGVRPRLSLTTCHINRALTRRMEEDLVEPLEQRLEGQLPGWTVHRDSASAEDDPDLALGRVRRWFQGEEASDLLFFTGATVGLHQRRRATDPALVGRPFVSRVHALDPADFDPRLPLGPRIAILDGSYTGGWEAASPYAFSELAPARAVVERDMLGPFSQALLAHPGGGMLAVAGKLDLAWLAASLRSDSPEAQALAGVLRMLVQGRTVGSAMQAMSDYYRLEATALASSELESDSSLRDRIRMCALNARNWLLLGDPAVRLQ